MPGDDFGATEELGFFFLFFFLEGNRTVGIEALQTKAFSTLVAVNVFYYIWLCCCENASKAGAPSTQRVAPLQKSRELQNSDEAKSR